MILVYTPGRVGTCAIHDTFKRHADEEVITLHSFTPSESLDGLPDDNIEIEKEKDRKIISEISNHTLVRAVTAVRDPIERAISSFSFFRHHYPERLGREAAYFLKAYNHDWYLNWFDAEIKAFFGIDVYEDLPLSEGEDWKEYKNDVMSLLVIKFPNLSALQTASLYCWNLPLGPVVKNNMIQCKPNRVPGYMELKNSRFPADYVNKMYDNKLVRHFWTQEEIAAFKAKWTE